MTLQALMDTVTDKTRFISFDDYAIFCRRFIEYTSRRLQARIVSQNENHYEFYQYAKEGHFNVTRPINGRLMLNADEVDTQLKTFHATFDELRGGRRSDAVGRETLNRVVYSLQQCIGAALDALPAGRSNQARKINGDLFERLIRLLIGSLNVDCVAGTVQVPVLGTQQEILFHSSYQHDLLIRSEGEVKVIGSVKTSSKDRIDKIFMDKFLYSRLTETTLPHIAIFLNDVQRKKARRPNEYGISATFLPGHFKAFTIKLNPLDGVYYCDVRPNMQSDALLAAHIKTLDHFFYSDLWSFIDREGLSSDLVEVEAIKDNQSEA